MKPLEKSGDLVDFKENIIFEEFKDLPLVGIRCFTSKIHKKYGFKGSATNLYRRIINYQIKKYGEAIYHEQINHTKEQVMQLSQKARVRRNDRKRRRYES